MGLPLEQARHEAVELAEAARWELDMARKNYAGALRRLRALEALISDTEALLLPASTPRHSRPTIQEFMHQELIQ